MTEKRIKHIKTIGFKKGHPDFNPERKGGFKKGFHPNSEWKKGIIPKNAVVFKKGETPWNKGKKGEYHIWENGRKFTEKWKQNISNGHKGIKYLNRKKGIKFTEEHKRKIGLKSSQRTGEKSNFWKGGITPKNLVIRASTKYNKWRISVYKRDNWTCVNCKKVGGNLEAHHIKEFSKYPELRFDINNGITLCCECHKKTKNYGNRKPN